MGDGATQVLGEGVVGVVDQNQAAVVSRPGPDGEGGFQGIDEGFRAAGAKDTADSYVGEIGIVDGQLHRRVAVDFGDGVGQTFAVEHQPAVQPGGGFRDAGATDVGDAQRAYGDLLAGLQDSC